MTSRALIMIAACFTLLLPLQSGRAADGFHELSFISIEGDPMPLSQYAGKVVLLVNTASFCGFTNQYAGLQTLYEDHQDDGLVVIGVPSDSFDQEPGSEKDVKFFCETNYGITFPLTDKVPVVGKNRHPVYDWAYTQLGNAAAPRWNFHKYLIGRDGGIAAWFPSNVPPSSQRIEEAITAALAAPVPDGER